MTETTARVDACMGASPGSQQAICREGRQLVHAADSQVIEIIKRTNRPAFRPGGPHSSTSGHRPRRRGDHNRRPCSKTGRTVAIRYGEAVTAPALIAMFRQVIGNDRVGGWRELKRHADPR